MELATLLPLPVLDMMEDGAAVIRAEAVCDRKKTEPFEIYWLLVGICRSVYSIGLTILGITTSSKCRVACARCAGAGTSLRAVGVSQYEPRGGQESTRARGSVQTL